VDAALYRKPWAASPHFSFRGGAAGLRSGRMTPEELEGRAETLELINVELTARLDRQADSDAKIDTKAVTLIGYTVVAASFLATRHPQAILAGFAYGLDAIAVGLSLWAYALARHQDVPSPRVLFNRYAARSKPAALAALAAERVRAFEANARRHERKSRLWRASLASLVLGVTLMVVSIVVQTGQHDAGAKSGHAGARPSASPTTAASIPTAVPSTAGPAGPSGPRPSGRGT